ncbi:hypothetical protein ACIQNK_10205 [Streptomyces sp. NPDC091273]|uniref:hypothetical protein n=1 Tax=Streptomyces sp. NPDC091273 TaxID=3365982 RepID=UPI0038180F2B
MKGVTGLFRSTDGGATWVRINDDQHQFGGTAINVISGDPDVYGRACLGGYGRGVVYGHLSCLLARGRAAVRAVPPTAQGSGADALAAEEPPRRPWAARFPEAAVAGRGVSPTS